MSLWPCDSRVIDTQLLSAPRAEPSAEPGGNIAPGDFSTRRSTAHFLSGFLGGQVSMLVDLSATQSTVTGRRRVLLATLEPSDSSSSSSHGRISMDAHHYSDEKLIFSDDFTEFDLSVWEHELTMGEEATREFEYYTNNRTNSFVRQSILYLKPTLTSDFIGEENVASGYTMVR